ncbi:TfuA-like protein [Celeribacter persicus]|uniref:TfuA-like core domain-containing protein n=1 Tax=Celeribacter persicus TaxID=1651082 RepID=A0A2T5HCL8_9RHOB|nr:TfuA-like protein [Celeribacter persicus]PTQ69314.1 hypothetical protein C8N42_11281 [Celeribacter persicus]
MHPNKTVIFAGPTISRSDITAHLPWAELRPPAGRGDIFAESWSTGDKAIIVDGYFRDQLSVGHKEILWLIEQGVETIGCASIGALRACELSEFGMIGVGSVFEMYANQEIDGDDEVAILHGPEELDFCALSVAMVNLRYGCERAISAGLMSPSAAEGITTIVKEMPFFERTWERLCQDGDLVKYHDELQLLEENIGLGRWNLKLLDAVSALTAAAEEGEALEGIGTNEIQLTRLTRHEEVFWRSRRKNPSGRWETDFDVLDAARLFDPDYPALHHKALAAMLREAAGKGQETSNLLGVKSTKDLPAELHDWFTEKELGSLSHEDLCLLILVRAWPIWHRCDWRSEMVNQMRGTDRWSDWQNILSKADEATNSDPIKVPPPQICASLFLRHWRNLDSTPKIEHARRGFHSLEELGRAAQRFFALDVKSGKNPRGDGQI